MKTNSFKSFFRFLSKNRLYTAVNIFGFAVSLAFVILIADYTICQLTTDNFQPDKEQLFILGNEHYMGTGYGMGERLKSRYPEIEDYCRVFLNASNMPVEVEGKKTVATSMLVDTSFFDMFGFKLLRGDPDQVLVSKENAVITESFARQVFGNQDPIGRQIVFTAETRYNAEATNGNAEPTNGNAAPTNGNAGPNNVDDTPISRTVSGIIEDIDNSVFPDNTQIITHIENVGNYNPAIPSPQMNNAGSIILFLKLHPGADLRSKAQDIRHYFSEFFWPYSGGAWKEVSFTPMKDAFFSPMHGNGLLQGNKSFVIILLTIGLTILFFAVINYLNLTVAQTGFRAREMATRRLLGANRQEIFRRFVGESVLLCLLSFLLAFLLAFAVQPLAAQLLQYKIDIIQSLTIWRVGGYVATVFLLGLLSGLAPATIITRYKPIDVVRGCFYQSSRKVFSKVFIVLQQVITTALIAGCLTIFLQIDHMISAPLGYDYNNILDISTIGFKDNTQIDAFRNEISQLSGVECVSLSCGTPLNNGNNNHISFGIDRMISFQTFYVDSTFLKMFGLNKIRENYSTTIPSFYLNETAIKELGLKEDALRFKAGKDYEEEYAIAGVFEDFQLGTILQNNVPMMMYVTNDLIHDPSQEINPWSVLVKVSGDPKATVEAIDQCFTKVTRGEAMQASFMEEQLRDSFSQQRNLAAIVLIFTCVAIFIGALGLLAMSTFFIQQRRREVAVRKVFGAARHEILMQLVATFLRYVGLAFVLAIPIIWTVMDWWLKDYSYRIKLSPWIFIIAGVFTTLVATFTVLWQSIRAAAINPSEAVKN